MQPGNLGSAGLHALRQTPLVELLIAISHNLCELTARAGNLDYDIAPKPVIKPGFEMTDRSITSRMLITRKRLSKVSDDLHFSSMIELSIDW